MYKKIVHIFGLQQIYDSERRIQDFPQGSAKSKCGDAKLLFGQLFPVNYVKMKEITPRGKEARDPDAFRGSANEGVFNFSYKTSRFALDFSRSTLVLLHK